MHYINDDYSDTMIIRIEHIIMFIFKTSQTIHFRIKNVTAQMRHFEKPLQKLFAAARDRLTLDGLVTVS